MTDTAATFEAHRHLLLGVAYRILGSMADAQDAVQETYLRWASADAAAIESPRAWLITACSRVAINRAKAAQTRRESYVGLWLPDPFPDAETPSDRLQMDESISLALMLALERLSAAERAVLLLREVFDYSFAEVASILDRSEAACRKLASRAQARLGADAPRFEVGPQEHQRLLEAFSGAAKAGNFAALQTLLAQDVELHADSGGKAATAPRVLRGEEVARFFVGVWDSRTFSGRMEVRWFNGSPGLVVLDHTGVIAALSVEIRQGRIARVLAHRNPDKLCVFGVQGRVDFGAARQ